MASCHFCFVNTDDIVVINIAGVEPRFISGGLMRPGYFSSKAPYALLPVCTKYEADLYRCQTSLYGRTKREIYPTYTIEERKAVCK